MAADITKRTLVGYRDVNVNVKYDEKFLDSLRGSYGKTAAKIVKGFYWGKEVSNLKFDAIVGNPPYQMMDGGNNASALPVYNCFVEVAKEIKPNYISMIFPARWFTGGRGLNEFRDRMLNDDQLCKIHDFPDANDCFQGVEIKGGICYILWTNGYHGDCDIFTHKKNMVFESKRPLLEKDTTVFIRNDIQVSVLKKVQKFREETFNNVMNAGRFFGFHTKVNFYSDGTAEIQTSDGQSMVPAMQEPTSVHTVKVYVHGGYCYIDPQLVPKNKEAVSKYKILLPNAGNPGSTIIGRPFISEPNSCSSNTYAVVTFKEGLDSRQHAENCMKYIMTKFFRFLVSIKTFTQHMAPAAYSFVPVQDYTMEWTDEKLYEKYGFTDEEIAYIEEAIKPIAAKSEDNSNDRGAAYPITVIGSPSDVLKIDVAE
jgi:site-specific DNA-methyltransferase (adenine-specific)